MYWLSYVVIAIIVVGLITAYFTEVYLTQILLIQNLLIFMLVFIPGLAYPYLIGRVYSDLAGNPIYLQSLDTLLSKGYTFLSLMYIHAGFMHIVGNAIILFFIGVALEDRIGKEWTAFVYFPAGVIATLGQYILDWGQNIMNLGASGAIMGLMGAIVFMFPKDRITMLLGPILMPNVRVDLAVAVFIMMQTVIAFLNPSSNIAHAAHFSGLGAGIVLGAFLKKMGVHEGRLKGPKRDYSSLKPLAERQDLQDIYKKIEEADEEDVRRAWAEHLLRKARCPKCGRDLNEEGCECGYDVWED